MLSGTSYLKAPVKEDNYDHGGDATACIVGAARLNTAKSSSALQRFISP